MRTPRSYEAVSLVGERNKLTDTEVMNQIKEMEKVLGVLSPLRACRLPELSLKIIIIIIKK